MLVSRYLLRRIPSERRICLIFLHSFFLMKKVPFGIFSTFTYEGFDLHRHFGWCGTVGLVHKSFLRKACLIWKNTLQMKFQSAKYSFYIHPRSKVYESWFYCEGQQASERRLPEWKKSNVLPKQRLKKHDSFPKFNLLPIGIPNWPSSFEIKPCRQNVTTHIFQPQMISSKWPTRISN